MNPAVLKNLSYGMYVIGTKYNGRPNACVANSVIQISSSDPEKVLHCADKRYAQLHRNPRKRAFLPFLYSPQIHLPASSAHSVLSAVKCRQAEKHPPQGAH